MAKFICHAQRRLNRIEQLTRHSHSFLTISLIVLIAGASASFLYQKTRVPIRANVYVPFEHVDQIDRILKSTGVVAWRPSASSLGAACFPVSNPRTIWLNEREILSQANLDGYYCAISYQPEWSNFKWSKRVGDPKTIGLQ